MTGRVYLRMNFHRSYPNRNNSEFVDEQFLLHHNRTKNSNHPSRRKMAVHTVVLCLMNLDSVHECKNENVSGYQFRKLHCKDRLETMIPTVRLPLKNRHFYIQRILLRNETNFVPSSARTLLLHSCWLQDDESVEEPLHVLSLHDLLLVVVPLSHVFEHVDHCDHEDHTPLPQLNPSHDLTSLFTPAHEPVLHVLYLANEPFPQLTEPETNNF